MGILVINRLTETTWKDPNRPQLLKITYFDRRRGKIQIQPLLTGRLTASRKVSVWSFSILYFPTVKLIPKIFEMNLHIL